MSLHLEKYQALGNDFLVLLDVDGRRPIASEEVRALCERHRGVGADGLMRVTTGPAQVTDVTMELYNADGGRAEMSGNGIRCLARAVADAGLLDGDELSVSTDAGIRRVRFGPAGELSVDMATVVVKEDVDATAAAVVEGAGASDLVDTGNPHLVVHVADSATVDVPANGQAVERLHGPINVEFVSTGPEADELTMQVWERGVGETSSCGTGAVAAAASARRWGFVGDSVLVHQPGGDLRVTFYGDDAVLAGPAQYVCSVEVKGVAG